MKKKLFVASLLCLCAFATCNHSYAKTKKITVAKGNTKTIKLRNAKKYKIKVSKKKIIKYKKYKNKIQIIGKKNGAVKLNARYKKSKKIYKITVKGGRKKAVIKTTITRNPTFQDKIKNISSKINTVDKEVIDPIIPDSEKKTDVIQVDDAGHITGLDLRNRNLTGTLDLSRLSHLANLNVSKNKLTGLVLGNSIMALDISKNKFTSFDCSKYTNLTILFADHNDLTNTLDVRNNLNLAWLSVMGNYNLKQI